MRVEFAERLRKGLVALALSVLIMPSAPINAASITGTLTGSVLTKATGRLVADAEVEAASPAQVLHTHTDAQGQFVFLTLLPDTYTLTLHAKGYREQRLSNIVIQADTQRVEVARLEELPLEEIGHITVGARNALVQPGVTADLTSIDLTQQNLAASLGGGSKRDSILSAISAAPGVFVPIGPSSYYSTVFIRGGDFLQTGYELDGVPIVGAYDPQPSSPLSNLGAQEVQVYSGAAPVDQQAQGIGGYINEVIKSGTYPGFATLDIGTGAPSREQRIKLELGGADGPDRKFTYYVGVAGHQLDQRINDQNNGTSLAKTYGPITNVIARDSAVNGCGAGPGPNSSHPSAGCYLNGGAASQVGNLPLGPNGYVVAPSFWGVIPSENEGDSVVNLHFALPRRGLGQHDDLQALFAQSQYRITTNSSLADFGGSLPDLLNGTITQSDGSSLSSCTRDQSTGAILNFAPNGCGIAGSIAPFFLDQPLYTGSLGATLTNADLASIAIGRYPGHTRGAVGEAIPISQSDTGIQDFSLTKLQYQHAISNNASTRLALYSLYGDRFESGIVSVFQPYFSDPFRGQYALQMHTLGMDASLTERLSKEHLARLDFGQSSSRVSAMNNGYSSLLPSSPVALLVNANTPLAGCYGQDASSGAIGVADCSSANTPFAPFPAASYVLPGASASNLQLVPGFNSPSLDAAATLTCGNGPCAYRTVSRGEDALVNMVGSRFTNASLEDRWNITKKLFADIGLRFDRYFYGTAHNASPAEQLYANSYNAMHCLSGSTIQQISAGAGCASLGGGYAPTQLTASSGDLSYNVLEPRLGVTYALNSHNVLRGTLGRYVQAPPPFEIQQATAQPSTPSETAYASLGFSSFTYPLLPASSLNMDASWEHSSRDNKSSLKLTPFKRTTKGEFTSIIINPKNSVVALVNGLNRDSRGVEVLWKYGRFTKNGLSTQLSYTYTHSNAHYPTLANGGSFVTKANQALQSYNGYTSFCSLHSSDPRCPTGAGYAAPCYTTAVIVGQTLTTSGNPSSTCNAGMIANPYWNSPPTNLLDPAGKYPALPGPPGLGAYGDASGNDVPHLATLIINYRHNRFTITPTIQFEAGARYGSPVVAQGVAPNTCAATYTGSTANDPRYVNGTPAGGELSSPYDASSCFGAVAIPDPTTGKFDGLGAYRQPSLLALNLDTSYDLSPSTTLNLSVANLLFRCFGGRAGSWNAGALACNYKQNPAFSGNFYNPNDQLQPNVAYPYIPVLSSEYNHFSAGSRLPTQVYLGAHFQL